MCEEYENDENILEKAALEWLEEVGYQIVNAAELTVGGELADRKDYHEVVLIERLRDALFHLNPYCTREVIDEAVRKLVIPNSPDMVANNRQFHEYVTKGIEVETREGNRNTTKRVVLFDFETPSNNEFLAVNQFYIKENKFKKPDILLFVNGLPLVMFELKSAVREGATISTAFDQLQTYKQEIPSVFTYNEFMVISDGIHAKAGTISSNEERFMVWRTIDGRVKNNTSMMQLEVLIKGMCRPEVLIDLIQNFILFKDEGHKTVKILAAYHQYHAVNKAISESKRAAASEGDNKIGVIWHTQGSGKSLTMAFYTAKLVQRLNNPTILVLTDRNDLDDQLFLTFSQSSELLRTTPKQATSREELKQLLRVNAGGIVFSTMQKFSPESGEVMPTLTERKDVIVIVDEAHRSQYGLSATMKRDTTGTVKTSYGYAKYLRDALPNASYIGFTGTPISKEDKSTTAVFGDYIDTYSMAQSVADGATVTVYYENRLIEVSTSEDLKIDDEADMILEEQEEYVVSDAKARWSRIEAIVGTKSRLQKMAKDFVEHFETRERAAFGKSMIVAMSRRIAVDLYKEIVALRPEWHSDEDCKGKIKIVMTGSSSDPKSWQPFIGTKSRRDQLANRMKDEEDELKIVIVIDMWLTGFDVPSLNTMYIDKMMQSHNLMQAIARVNRVFKDKEGGLVVDYIGIADNLKEAVDEYTPNDRQQVGVDTESAIKIMLENYILVKEFLYGCDWSEFNSKSAARKNKILNITMDFIISKGNEETKRFKDTVQAMVKAFSLCPTEPEAQKINAEIGFFKAVKSSLSKLNLTGTRKTIKQVDLELKQLLSKSIIAEDIVDIYDSLGLQKPDISILSDEFLQEVRELPEKNIAITLLDKLLEGKVKAVERTNLVQARKFSEMLRNSIEKYNRRSIETAKIIEELIELAKEMNNAQHRGDDLGLTSDEAAFYDALADHGTAKQVMGDDQLKKIAHELTAIIKENMSIDWNVRDSAKANMRKVVKRLLRKYGYPPEFSEEAVKTVVEQAESMAESIYEDGFV